MAYAFDRAKAMTDMPSQSAGIIAFRRRPGTIEVLLVHPGGPFWRNKDGRLVDTKGRV
jgi:predicted NUDIX family NTP pyrophosphohydrolase